MQTFKRTVYEQLDADATRRLITDLAGARREIAALEAEKKAEGERLGKEIKECEARRNELIDQLDRGKPVMVECRQTIRGANLIVTRLDTGAVVEERAATAEELEAARQQELALDKPDADAAPAETADAQPADQPAAEGEPAAAPKMPVEVPQDILRGWFPDEHRAKAECQDAKIVVLVKVHDDPASDPTLRTLKCDGCGALAEVNSIKYLKALSDAETASDAADRVEGGYTMEPPPAAENAPATPAEPRCLDCGVTETLARESGRTFQQAGPVNPGEEAQYICSACSASAQIEEPPPPVEKPKKTRVTKGRKKHQDGLRS